MIKNLLDNDENKKDKLFKLSFREIRLEAKKLSIHLYSRKTKKELVELILKDQKTLLIENKSDDVFAEADRITLEKAKAEEDRITLEKAKAEEDRITLEKAKAKENVYTISNKNKNLKRLLSKSFPNKKITVTDNKDGSQTILIN